MTPEILHDEKAHRDAPVERIDLSLVGQQLDDDDRARERQGHRDIGGGERVHAERHRNQESDHRREDNLADAGSQRDRAERPNSLEIELEAHHEQQQRNADARKERDLFVLRNQADPCRPDDNADRDEGDDQGLAEPGAEGADKRGSQERQCDFGESITQWHGVGIQTVPAGTSLSRCGI